MTFFTRATLFAALAILAGCDQTVVVGGSSGTTSAATASSTSSSSSGSTGSSAASASGSTGGSSSSGATSSSTGSSGSSSSGSSTGSSGSTGLPACSGFAFSPTTYPNLGTYIRSVVAGDLDGDGRADLAFADFDNSRVRTYLATDGGALVPGASLDVPDAYGVTLADMNGDGRLDVLATAWVEDAWFEFTNLGDGGYQSHAFELSTFGTGGSNPSTIAVADLNRDRLPDVVISYAGANQLQPWFGEPDGGFAPQPAISLASNTRPEGIATVDWNGDGWPDVAAAELTAGYTDLFLNLDGGSYDGPQQQRTIVYPNAIAVRDLNGDGLPDLAVSGDGANVFINPGDGGLGTAVHYATPQNDTSYGMVEADFDGDGKLDLAIGSFGQSKLMLLRGEGDGTFVDGGLLDVTSPTSVTSGDFNGDGRPDLAVISEDSPTAHSLTVLINTCR